MVIPNFILKKLYKPGSLRKTPDGVAFTICNKIAKGEVNKVIGCTINRKKISPENILLFPHGQEPIKGEVVSNENQLTLALNSDVDVLLEGFTLSEGKYSFVISLDVESLGVINIKVKDNMSHSPSPSLKTEHQKTIKEVKTRDEVAPHIKVSILGAGSSVFA